MSSITLFLVLIFAIFYFILAKIRLDWAVMLMLAALPTYLIRFRVLGIPFTLLEVMILIAFVVWFVWHTRFLDFIRGKYSWQDLKENRKKRMKYPFGWEIMLVLLVSYGAAAVAGFSSSALGIWKAYFFEPALVFILVLNVFRYGNTKKLSFGYPKLSFFLWPLTVSALGVSAAAIFQRVTGLLVVEEFWPRVTSVFSYPNAVGLYLGPLVLVMLGWIASVILSGAERSEESREECDAQERRSSPGILHYAQNDKVLALFIGITICLSLLSIYFAKSEGALIGVVAGLVVFGLLAGKKIRWVTVALVMVVGVGIMAYAPTRDYAIKKMTLRDLSGEIRKQQWRETWQMLKDGRIMPGAGLANYQMAIASYHQEGIFFNKDNDPDFQRKIVIFDDKYRAERWQPVEIYLYPHNIFLNFWTELGLFGALLFIWITIKFIYLGFINIRNLGSGNRHLVLGLICAMVVIVVHGMVDVPYFKNDLAVMFWVLVGMMSLVDLCAKMSKIDGR